MMPETIADYFREQGYTVTITDCQDAIDVYSKQADACILWYLFWPDYGLIGGHFIEYHKSGNGYLGHNTSGYNGKSFFSIPSDYGLRGKRFHVVGIFIYK